MTPPNGVQELDPGYTKSRLYSSFAWNHGWVVKYDSCGRSVAVKRTDHSWIHGDDIVVTEHDNQTKYFGEPTCTNSSINNAPGEGDDKTSSNKSSNETRGSGPDSSGEESTNTRIGTTGVNNNNSTSLFTIKNNASGCCAGDYCCMNTAPCIDSQHQCTKCGGRFHGALCCSDDTISDLEITYNGTCKQCEFLAANNDNNINSSSTTLDDHTNSTSKPASNNPVPISREPTHICCRKTFYNYWKEHHPKLIVRKPSRDICSICYKFNASYRKKAKKKRRKERTRRQNNLYESDEDSSDDDLPTPLQLQDLMNHDDDDDDDDSNDDNDNDDDDDEDSEYNSDDEETFIKVGQHVREAKSMRDMFERLRVLF